MTSLPKTPIKGDAETRRFLEAMRQAVSNLNDTQVTVSDLKRQSFWDRLGVDIGGGTDDPTLLRVDPPTVPTNLVVTGIFQNIILEWSFAPYRGHAFTRVYRNTVNNFATASVLASANTTTFADQVSTGQGFYYWVTNVNGLGVESAPNAVQGTFGQTGQDIPYVLNLLNGAITENQLYQTLGSRINLIDGNGAGSVNARISSEATLRQTADNTLAQNITNLSTTVNGNTTSIQTLQSTSNGLSAQYTVKVDNNGYVSGFGLASTLSNATPTSSFIVRADRFAITSPESFTVVTVPGVATCTINVQGPNGVFLTQGSHYTATFDGASLWTITLIDADPFGRANNQPFGSYVGDVISGNAAATSDGTYTITLYNTATATFLPNGQFGINTSPLNTGARVFPVSNATVVNQGGLIPRKPFIVQTTPTVENGVTIQPGVYMDTAFIKDASIDSAKIRSVLADNIVTGRLKVAIGLDGDLNVGTGKIVFDNGVYMKVQGVGFGSANQFLEWFGPKQSSFFNCTEANAIAYLKTNGDAYFGGSLSAGLLRNAATTSLQTADASVVVGPFSSNGDPKVVVLSYSYRYHRNILNAVSYTGTPSATLLLQRSFDGANWTTLTTLNVTGMVSGDPGFGAGEPGFILVEMGGSATFTDTSGPGNQYHYRGIIGTRTLPTINSTGTGTPTITQYVTVASTES